jgi:outer membrane protein
MSFKRHALTLIAALLVSAYAPTIYAQVKVAVVDLQRALNETEDGRHAKRRLKQLFKSRQAKLNERQKKLKKMKANIQRQKNVLSKKALQKKLKSYQQSFVDLQTTYVEYQRELAKKESKLTKKILARMQRIVRRIGQKEGYTVVLERNKGGVVWAPNHIDLTDRVIQKYNAKYEDGGN